MEVKVVQHPRLEDIILEPLDAVCGTFTPINCVWRALALTNPKALVAVTDFRAEVPQPEAEAGKVIPPLVD